ncbi:DUF5667 domain-containing protein [Streptoalloteichus hindustanus]|uniref:DUF5667 domain-containing protein n=1 Tax=Streptoalloteichus hindustanus TaxID=2017 RepID=A0A1M4TXL6_STRHI|nr:DUF5667 domain-containing protein [Streptoalloteichus hindustanus]SHE49168.1 hypothetical protein SAMN05444320_101227 [Streptoalloteichus hindustanus]
MTRGRTPFGDRGRRGRFARATEALPPLTTPLTDVVGRSDKVGPGSVGTGAAGTGAAGRDTPDEPGRDVDPAPFTRLDDQLTSELAIVALLRRAADGVGPDPAARERMRQRLLAELAARPPVEPAGAVRRPRRRPGRRPPGRGRDARRPDTGSSSPEGPAAGEAGPRHGAHGRLAVALVATLCLVLSLSGMSLVLSRDALPGDPLYRVKRSAENASLGLTFGDESRAVKHLEFAAARMDEIEALVGRSRPPTDDYLTALADFEEDAAAGARLLVHLGGHGDDRLLETLRGWAEQQERRLAGSTAALPRSAATRAEATTSLLTRIRERAVALAQRADCATVTRGDADDIGLLPSAEPCVPPAGRRDPRVPAGERPLSGGNAPPAPSDQPASPLPDPPSGSPRPPADPPPASVLAEPPAATERPGQSEPGRPARPEQPGRLAPTPRPGVLAPPSAGGRDVGNHSWTALPLPPLLGAAPPFVPDLPVWHDR